METFSYFPDRTPRDQVSHLLELFYCGVTTFRGWPGEMLKAIVGSPGDRNWRLRQGGEMISPRTHWSSPLAVIGRDIYGLAEFSSIRTFVDIGANIGSFSVAVAKRWPSAKGIAYEPIPTTFDYLVRNLAKNCPGRVQPICSAVVANAKGSIRMMFDSRSPQSSSRLQELMRSDLPLMDVETISWESALGRMASIDLLKIDIEGEEYNLISDEQARALSHARYIVLEYHPVSGRHPSEIEAKIVPLGFRVERLEARERLMLFKNVDVIHD